MVSLSFLAIISGLGAWLTGYWALETATASKGEPGHEFAAKQLTIAAWTLACTMVASLAVIGVTEILTSTAEACIEGVPSK